MLSNYGERPIHYDFGANLRRLIFEQEVDMPQKIRDAITRAVNKWMSFVNIVNIDIFDNTTDPTLLNNEIKIKIRFEVGQLQGELSQNIRA